MLHLDTVIFPSATNTFQFPTWDEVVCYEIYPKLQNLEAAKFQFPTWDEVVCYP